MVFIGYGMRIPEAKYDDLAGLDLRGKIAVYVNAAGPAEASSAIKAHYSSAGERWNALQAAGAVGVAMIANPRRSATPPEDGAAADDAAGRGRGGRDGQGGGGGGAGRGPQRAFLLADVNLREATGQKIAVTIMRRGGEKFFEGSGHTYEEIIKLAQENRPLPT